MAWDRTQSLYVFELLYSASTANEDVSKESHYETLESAIQSASTNRRYLCRYITFTQNVFLKMGYAGNATKRFASKFLVANTQRLVSYF